MHTMKNNFAKEYAKSMTIKSQYKAAKEAHNEDAMLAASKAYKEFFASIVANGTAYARLYTKYESAQERGNALIDLDESLQDEDIANFVASLREYGIEQFVFSSTWSSAVETAWLFQQSGCKLEGLVEINGRCKEIFSEEYEKVHGYLFSVC